jgi:hypothetical protein
MGYFSIRHTVARVSKLARFYQKKKKLTAKTAHSCSIFDDNKMRRYITTFCSVLATGFEVGTTIS